MNILLILKGFIVGIGKIIPGISGSMLAMSLGIYDKLIDSITNFSKKNLKFLFNFSVGVLLAIILFSKVLLYLLNNYYFITMSFILGLILGTIINFKKNIIINKRNIFLFLIFFFLMFSLSFIESIEEYIFIPNILNYLYIVILGFIDATTSIIPGISGTAIFMLLGSYKFVLSILSKPFSLNFILYGIGLMVGIIITCYVMKYLLTKYRNTTYIIILAFSLASLLILFLKVFKTFNIINIMVLFIGIVIGYLFDK